MTDLPWDQRLARRLVPLLARTPATPNAVTTFGLMLGVGAALLYAQGEPVLADWAAPLFMLAVFNDHLDGELARATGRTSTFGHYYDHVAAATSYIGTFVGIGIGLTESGLGAWAPALGASVGVSIFAIFSVRTTMEMKLGKHVTSQPNFAGFEIEDALYLLAPATWLGWLEPLILAAGVVTPLFLLWVVWEWWRHQRPAGSLGEGSG